MKQTNPDTIFMSRKEFEKLPYEHQRILMAYYRENYSADYIKKRMGFPSAGGSFYEKLRELKLPTNLLEKNPKKNDDMITKLEVNEDDFHEILQLVSEKNPKTKSVITVDIHGRVDIKDLQKVIGLADQFGLDVDFRKTQEKI